VKLIDFLIAPITFSILIIIAYAIRAAFADQETKHYFFPALLLKMMGAIGVGLIYQFYYGGGDTFSYYTHGAAHIVDAFYDNFSAGFQAINSTGRI